MDKERFEDLKESIIEAGKVMRGEMEPSREFIYEIDRTEIQPPLETWAVCVETDDEKLLIPGKIYEIKIGKNRVWVTDETDESVLYPKDFFMPIALPAEVTQKLTNLAEAA